MCLIAQQTLGVVTYRRQQNNSPRMNKQAGPKHGEMLGEAARCVECAALQWRQALAAPAPLPHAVVLAQRAERTHRHADGAAVGQGRGQVDGEVPVCPAQPVEGETVIVLLYSSEMLTEVRE